MNGRMVAEDNGARLSKELLNDHQQFEELLFELSKTFINIKAEEIDENIKSGLALLGKYLGMDRVTLAQFDESCNFMNASHWYTGPGIPLPEAKLLHIDIPWFFEQLRENKIVATEDYDEILTIKATRERQYIEKHGIKSIVVIPLRTKDTPLGGVFFVSFGKRVPLPKEIIRRLVLACDILTRALGRKIAWEKSQTQLKFDHLLAEISAMFIQVSSDELESTIGVVLKMIGEHFDVDFIFMWRFVAEQDGYRIIRQWQRSGTNILGKVSLVPTNTPWVFGRLQANLACAIDNIEELPETAVKDKETAAAMGIKSVLVVPFVTKGEFKGSISIGTTVEPRRWERGQQEKLCIIGEIISNAILRMQAERKLKSALSQLEQLKNQREAENAYLREEIKIEHNFNEIIGTSASLNQIFVQIGQVAKTNATVLIQGETGTGKELIARAVHNTSDRNDKPLVKINCATLPGELIESELFGHEKGAFSGAHTARTGRFELGDGATLFLDEIGELPMELQPKLLRVLQEGEFERLGSSKTRTTNVRVIAATNRDLEKEVEAGRFRGDLWYRLNVFPIIVPPLRERKEDIALLTSWFLKKICKQIGKNIDVIPKKIITDLERYDWPGNVRELRNMIERAVIISPGKVLELVAPRVAKSVVPPGQTLKEIECNHILNVLEQCNWVIEGGKGACRVLDIKPSTLRNRMKKIGISRR